MRPALYRRKRGHRGATMVEYALLIIAIAVLAAGAFRLLGSSVSGGAQEAAAALDGAAGRSAGAAADQGAPSGAPSGEGKEAPSEGRGFWGNAWEFTKGVVVDGAWGTVTGLAGLGKDIVVGTVTAIAHPIDTAKAVGNGLYATGSALLHPVDTATSLYNGAVAIKDEIVKSCSENPARCAGNALFQGLTLASPTKLAKLGALKDVGNAEKAALLLKAEEAEKAAKLKKAEEAAKVARNEKCAGGICRRGGMCFVAGTKVLMADGSTKAIEEVEEGDAVLTDDPEDADGPEPKQVTQVHRTATYRLFHIDVGDGEEVVSTGAHPFWTRRGWVPAEELTTTDALADWRGASVAVRAVAAESRDALTYNLTVDGTHTFFVVAGDRSVLVHNIDPWDIQFSREVKAGEAFQHGPWKGKTVEDAIAEARKLGKLPPGLEFNAARVNTVNGDQVVTAINNRTLYVAQEAGLRDLAPINDMDSGKAYGQLEKQLNFARKKGGTGEPFYREPRCD